MTTEAEQEQQSSPDLSETRLEEIEKRMSKATPGPWLDVMVPSPDEIVHGAPTVVDGKAPGFVVRAWKSHPDKVANVEFIAHARQDIPDLLAEVRRLQSALTAARAERAKLHEAVFGREIDPPSLRPFDTIKAVVEYAEQRFNYDPIGGDDDPQSTWDAIDDAKMYLQVINAARRPLEGQRDA